jgi:XTP/dITP diphosphohydrolase
MRLILASNNKKKMAELGAILSDMGVEITGQRDAGCDFEVEETGTTFEENARLKAEAVLKATGCAAVADDSGLMVDALNGEPGVYSARYTGTHDATDEERYSFLLKKLGENKNRSAKFVCCICCMLPDGRVIETRGECPGSILYAPRGKGGFGYDPVFMPEGFDCSMAELGTEVKNKISHRARALEKFKAEYKEYANDTDK